MFSSIKFTASADKNCTVSKILYSTGALKGSLFLIFFLPDDNTSSHLAILKVKYFTFFLVSGKYYGNEIAKKISW